MKSDSYGIASRAKGSDHGMRERASMTRAGSITKRPGKERLAEVGKPYKLPGWSTLCGNLLALKRTLFSPENLSDSAWDCLRLFDWNRRTMHESALPAREVPRF